MAAAADRWAFDVQTLHALAEKGDASALKELIMQRSGTGGSLTDFRDMNDNTALHRACAVLGNSATAALLLDREFSVNAINAVGETPLHCAVQVGDVETVSLLLTAATRGRREAPNLNAGNDHGNTPLFYACQRRDLAMAVLLLRAGAWFNIENASRRTPQQMCSSAFWAQLQENCGDAMRTRRPLALAQIPRRSADAARVAAQSRFVAQGSVSMGISQPLVRLGAARKETRKHASQHGEYLDMDVVVKLAQPSNGLQSDADVRRAQERFLTEARGLRRLCHPNLHPILGVLDTSWSGDEPDAGRPRQVGVVTEFVTYAAIPEDRQLSPAQLAALPSSLHDYLQDAAVDLSQAAVLELMLGIARGVEYLHSQSGEHYFHGNLKSSNVLVNASAVPLLTDYGWVRSSLACTLEQVYLLDVTYLAPELLRNNAALSGRRQTMTAFRYTVAPQRLPSRTTAPLRPKTEVGESAQRAVTTMRRWLAAAGPASGLGLEGDEADAPAETPALAVDLRACDIYALGILMWEIALRQPPYAQFVPPGTSLPPNPTLVALKVLGENMRPDIPSFVPEPLADLISRCWADQPELRPSASDVVSALTSQLYSPGSEV